MFLSSGLLFLKLMNVVENAIVAHDWLMLALIALAAAAILSLWKLAYVVHRCSVSTPLRQMRTAVQKSATEAAE